MSDLASLLSSLHEELARDLLTRLRSGEASASELNVVRQFLKDNHIDSIAAKDNPLGQLIQGYGDLPFLSDEELMDSQH